MRKALQAERPFRPAHSEHTRQSRADRAVWGPRLLLCLVVAVLNLPFLFQAFHIDDRIYLEVAHQILREPGFPYRFPILFEGIQRPDAASSSHLPLTAYYLALVHSLVGHDVEWVYHLAFLVFPLIAVLSFYEICRRECEFPLAAATLLAVSPALVTLSHTLMSDVPQLAAWLLALAGFLGILEEPEKRLNWVFCGLGLAGAAMLSLLAAGLVMLLATLWMTSGGAARAKTRFRRVALILSIPFAVWSLWLAYSYVVYQRLVLIKLGRYVIEQGAFEPSLLADKLVAFALSLGAVVICPPALWPAPAKRQPLLAGMTAALVLVLALVIRVDGWSASHRLLFGAFLASGCFLAAVILSNWRSLFTSDRGVSKAFLLLFVGIFAGALLVYYTGAVRYMLLAAPAGIYFWIHRLAGGSRSIRSARLLIGAGIALTLPWSLWIALTDYHLAGLYRSAAEQLMETYRRPGRTVYFTAEWGLRYYLEQAGARPLPQAGREPGPGDIIVKPERASPWPTHYDNEHHSRILERRPLTSGNPLRLLSTESHAGFYSTAWGLLPVSFSSDPIRDVVYVLEVTRRYEGPLDQPQGQVDLSYRFLRRQIQALLQDRIAPRDQVLVVSKGDQVLLNMLGPNFSHFPQAEDGSYVGYHPSNSDEAISHLKQLQARGAEFILFPETSRWWLKYYAALSKHLSERARLIADEPGVAVLFELQSAEGPEENRQ